MKILFVHSLDDAQSVAHPLASLEDIQMGISYISAVLKKDGHSTALVVISSRMERAGRRLVLDAIRRHQPGIVAFTAVFSQYPMMSRLAVLLKARCPEVFLVIGGPHASLNPDEAIEGGFDAVCVGEGEGPMAELARMLEEGNAPSGIANLAIRRPDGSVERNPTRPFLDDLDGLPFPDRDMWLPWVREKAGARLSVLLGRGCPFNCAYCSNHGLARLAQGRYVRLRSPENILEEIRLLHERFGDKRYFYLEVETIASDKDWLLKLCGALKKHNDSLPAPLAFGCNFRITKKSLDEEIFKALHAANFVSINMGLESGSERVRREILKRTYSNEEALRAADLAHKHGLRINLYDLIGIPGETFPDHLETVRVTRRINPDRVIKSIFFPYPGTNLHDLCRDSGFLPSRLDFRLERRKAVMNLPGFSKRRIQRAYTWFEYNVYKGIRPLPELLIRTLRNRIKSSLLADSVYLRIVQIPWFDRLRARGEGSVNALSGTAQCPEPDGPSADS